LPWIVGIVLASVNLSQGLLGSYRGLYCYVTEWNNVLTGGVTAALLIASAVTTVIFYIKIGLILTGVKKGVKKLIFRGGLLVLALLCTWLTFAVCGFMHLVGTIPSVPAEMIGGIMVTLQALVDSAVLNMTPGFRDQMSDDANGSRSSGRGDRRSKRSKKLKGAAKKLTDLESKSSTSSRSINIETEMSCPKSKSSVRSDV